MREHLEQEKREHIAEENHQKDLLRMEIERRMEMERRVEEERREAEERTRARRRAARLQLEEEANTKGVWSCRLEEYRFYNHLALSMRRIAFCLPPLCLAHLQQEIKQANHYCRKFSTTFSLNGGDNGKGAETVESPPEYHDGGEISGWWLPPILVSQSARIHRL